MELSECINLRPERALAVLLAYLRYRGPFFTWSYRGKEMGIALGRLVQAYWLTAESLLVVGYCMANDMTSP